MVPSRPSRAHRCRWDRFPRPAQKLWCGRMGIYAWRVAHGATIPHTSDKVAADSTAWAPLAPPPRTRGKRLPCGLDVRQLSCRLMHVWDGRRFRYTSLTVCRWRSLCVCTGHAFGITDAATNPISVRHSYQSLQVHTPCRACTYGSCHSGTRTAMQSRIREQLASHKHCRKGVTYRGGEVSSPLSRRPNTRVGRRQASRLASSLSQPIRVTGSAHHATLSCGGS